jgi:undecaprenyl-diphosphatase
MMPSLLHRLDARDRALFARWAMAGTRPRYCRIWRGITHLGGASCTIAVTLVPLLLEGSVERAAWRSLVLLISSHLVVQAIKRTVGRPRPSARTSYAILIAEPDRFSFPSGHATAALSVAIGYASVYPAYAPLLTMLAITVGFSRVVLAVHYPGDVVVGQLIAVLTATAWWIA